MSQRRPPQVWLATLFGAGLSPVGPGTAGSLLTSLLLLLLWWTKGGQWSFWAWQGVLVAGIVVSSVLTVILAPWVLTYWGKKDPGAFVLDEVAGICLTILGVPMWGGWGEGIVLLAGFLAFRAFDVFKPWPCKKLEGLPGGWGVLADDLMAALYANIFCQFTLRYVA